MLSLDSTLSRIPAALPLQSEKIWSTYSKNGVNLEPYTEIPKGMPERHLSRDSLPSLLFLLRRGNLPVIYMYDSYQISSHDWLSILSKNGAKTIRGTPIDAVVLGLWVESGHSELISGGQFDGFYTYFASDVRANALI
jgi:hypothetical protein